jgi:hypothetical protein
VAGYLIPRGQHLTAPESTDERNRQLIGGHMPDQCKGKGHKARQQGDGCKPGPIEQARERPDVYRRLKLMYEGGEHVEALNLFIAQASSRNKGNRAQTQLRLGHSSKARVDPSAAGFQDSTSRRPARWRREKRGSLLARLLLRGELRCGGVVRWIDRAG